MTPNTSNVERAAKVLNETGIRCGLVCHPLGTGAELATLLDSRGLLTRHSPEAEALRDRAVEACVAMYREWPDVSVLCGPCAPAWQRVGRELAALAEKERGPKVTKYAIAPTGDRDQHWSVLNEDGESVYLGPKPNALAVAAALNEVPR